MSSIKKKLEQEIKEQELSLKCIESMLEEFTQKYSEDVSKELKIVNDHKRFIKNPELQIAIVGAIKAGKSTLMNSLLKEKIASTEVTPETATLTKFKYSEKKQLKITFYDKKEWKYLWDSVEASCDENDVFKKEFDMLGAKEVECDYVGKEEINEYPESLEELKELVKKYSSSKSKAHYFVKEIEIGLDNLSLPKDVIFVDTPGLNDVVAYRSNITRDYIARANAVIVCVNASSMRNEDYTTIVKVFENVGSNKDKVLILGTQRDKFNNPQKDWENQKKEWEKYLGSLYKNEELMHKNILGVSSYIYHIVSNISAKKETPENEIDDVINFTKKMGMKIFKKQTGFIDIVKNILKSEESTIRKNAEEIKELTNIEELEDIIRGKLLEKSINIIIKDMEERYKMVWENIHTRFIDFKKANDEALTYLSMNLEELKSKKAEKTKQILEIKEIEKELLESFSTIKQEISNQLSTTNKKINEELKKIGI